VRDGPAGGRVNFIGYDTETRPFAPGRCAPTIVCVTTSRGPGHKDIFAGPDAARATRALLEGAALGQHTLVIQNAAYDVPCILANWPEMAPEVFCALDAGGIRCTKVREALVQVFTGEIQDEKRVREPAKSLVAMAHRYLDKRVAGKAGLDSWRLRYSALEGLRLEMWPAEPKRYAADDAVLHREVFEAQTRHWCSSPTDALYDPRYPQAIRDEVAQVQAAVALALARCRGFRTDPQAIASARVERENVVWGRLVTLAGMGLATLTDGRLRKNLRLVREHVARVATKQGVEIVETDTGLVCIAKQMTRKLDDEGLRVLSEAMTADSEISKYLDKLEAGVDRPICPNYDPLRATGRVSASSPPLQQLPRNSGIRECIIPREGFVFASADLGRAELTALAQGCIYLFGFSALADEINNGIDPLSAFAAALLGCTYAEIRTGIREGSEKHKTARGTAKAALYGYPGGLGHRVFAEQALAIYGVRVSAEQSKSLKALWFQKYPEMRLYLQRVNDLANAGGGRFVAEQFCSGRMRGDLEYKNGCNTLFQGAVADVAKHALYTCTREAYLGTTRSGAPSPLVGSYAPIFMHDEIFLEVPEERGHEAALRLQDILVASSKVFIPDVRAEAEPLLSRRWAKRAKPTRGPDGRLVPWDW